MSTSVYQCLDNDYDEDRGLLNQFNIYNTQ